jgi:hypothetical protein
VPERQTAAKDFDIDPRPPGGTEIDDLRDAALQLIIMLYRPSI